MSASTTQTKTPEGGHSGPPNGGLENSPSVTHETELGRLPADWRVVPLREAYSFTKKPRGLTIPLDGTIPFLPMDAIPIGRVSVSAFEERQSSKLTSGTYIENGDLIVAKITPSFENGKQAIVKWDRPFGFATTEVIPIQEIEGISDKHYLFHILLHPEVRADLAGKMDGTTGRQRLSKEVLGAKQIPLPPLAEQRKIAGVLGVVQRSMEQQERLLALTAELKKALLHQLFTQGLRGEPQKQTEIGPMPESWDMVSLGDVMSEDPKNGLYKHSSTYGSGTPILRINDFTNDGDIVNSASNRVITDASENRLYALRKDDIVTNRVNSLSHIGKTALIGELPEPMVFESNMMRFRVDERRALPRYIFRLLNSPLCKKQIVGNAKRAVAQSSINQGNLKATLLPLPSVEVQEEITEILETVAAKMSVHEWKKQSLTALFRTLLHQLMTAQLRVHDLNLPELAALTTE